MALSRRGFIAGAGAAATGMMLTSASTASATEPAALAQTAAGTSPLPIASRNSVYTRSGAGPLYWNIYGWAFPHNAPIPEAEWQANIDWLAKDFAPHGYEMACTDGWIEGSSRTTDNGYIITYNDDWQHDWAYWARYLKARDMTLGVYYNPLWVHKAAVADTSKTVLGRPDIRIADLITEGDFFAGGIGGDTLYWVDVTKDGAKEYVQGYVNYFKDLGVPYLRVDFLSWYENGYDAGIGGSVGQPHGRENYETALRWMHEAAAEDIELSLVMPHLFDHAALEIQYGDMVRIDRDTFDGGWRWLSGGRQAWQNSWPNWENPFQGFTGYADRSGRGQLILDGDFLRMHTFANDDERRTCISLMTIAGSPLTIADLHSTIADHGWVYTNDEVLDLHRQGLVGKPYFKNATSFAKDPSSRDSERWAGQLPDGSWAVALFNRSDATATRSLDLAALGISGTAQVRDLWQHQDLGRLDKISADLPAHGTLLVKVTPDDRSRYQAAFAAWGGGAGFGNTIAGHHAMGYATIADDGASVTFAVQAARSGTYQLALRYAADARAALTLGVEKPHHKTVSPAQSVPFPATGGQWDSTSATVTLDAGENLVTLIRTPGDSGSIALNHIELK